jgi:hypothetical protein
LLLLFAGLTLVTAYPVMSWLVEGPSFGRLLAVELWLSFLFASYNASMVVYLTEIMPAEVRTAGFSLAYSLATALFGGFTPAIITYLIHLTHNRAISGAWLSFAALCSGISVLVVRPPGGGRTSHPRSGGTPAPCLDPEKRHEPMPGRNHAVGPLVSRAL